MAAHRPDDIDFVRSAFGAIWPVHLSGFTQLLIKLRRRFDGDLDLMLVLAVIAARTRPDRWSPEPITYRAMTVPRSDSEGQWPINVQSLADYSGIPRETVRRKVIALIEKGWIERDAQGQLSIARAAAADLEQSTLDSMGYLASIAAAVLSAKSLQDGKKRG